MSMRQALSDISSYLEDPPGADKALMMHFMQAVSDFQVTISDFLSFDNHDWCRVFQYQNPEYTTFETVDALQSKDKLIVVMKEMQLALDHIVNDIADAEGVLYSIRHAHDPPPAASVTEAVATLKSRRLEMSYLFTEMHRHFLQLRLVHAAGYAPMSAWSDDLPLDTFTRSFYKQPFQVTLDVLPTQLEHADKAWLDSLRVSMSSVGRRWADCEIFRLNSSVSSLAQVQLDCMHKLWNGMIQGKDQDTFSAGQFYRTVMQDEPEDPEANWLEHVVEIQSTIQGAIQRANGQTFSIAFCGMVKAG